MKHLSCLSRKRLSCPKNRHVFCPNRSPPYVKHLSCCEIQKKRHVWPQDESVASQRRCVMCQGPRNHKSHSLTPHTHSLTHAPTHSPTHSLTPLALPLTHTLARSLTDTRIHTHTHAHNPRLVQSWFKVGPESASSQPRVGLKSAKFGSQPNAGPKSAQSLSRVGFSQPKVDQTSVQSLFKVGQKSTQSQPR